MKKIALLLIALVSFSGFAQQRLESGKKSAPLKRAEAITPEQRAKQLTAELGLNPVQQAQVKALFEENEKKHPVEEKKTAKKGDKLETPKDRDAKAQEKKAERMQFEAEIKKVLTPEQFEKWKKSQDVQPVKEPTSLEGEGGALQPKKKL